MLVKLQIIALSFALLLLQGCEKEVWNDPYPQYNAQDNTLYTAFTERPKHLDPAVSYSSEEALITYQVYESPLQYHYLKRPYELVPLIAKAMPTVSYVDKDGKALNEQSNDIAFSIYRIEIKPGIYYQPHPAFAKNAQGEYLYHFLTAEQVKHKHTLMDFPKQETRELIAQDFVYEIKRLADPTVNSPIFGLMENYIVGFSELGKDLQQRYQKINIENHNSFLNLNDVPFEGAKIVDQYTYEIKIKGKYPQFLCWLSMPFFAPIPWEGAKFYSQAVLLKKNISLDWYPIGTGPFILQANNPNAKMLLVRNPNFHGEIYPLQGDVGDEARGLLKNAGKPLPFVDKVIFILEKESIPYWTKFLQGYYDRAGITSANFDQALQSIGGSNLALSQELKTKGIKLASTVAPTIYFWGFNMLDETVGGYSESKKKLRQAIAIAMDIEEYINIFLNGSGIAAQSPLAPGIFGFKEDKEGINPYIYNIDNNLERKSIAQAKKLLNQAGYTNGIDPKTKQPLVLYYDTPSSGGPESTAQLEWIRKQFSKLGIDLIVRGTQYNRFQDKMASGDFQLFAWGWNADYPDPENFLFLLYGPHSKVKFGGENMTNYNNSRFNTLFDKMKVMNNTPERAQIIQEMITILREDSPLFGGLHTKTYTLSQPWVGPLKPNEMSRNTVKYISIDPFLRAKLRTQWNKPIFWPIGFCLLFLALGCIPAGISYWRKMHRPYELKKPAPLKDRY